MRPSRRHYIRQKGKTKMRIPKLIRVTNTDTGEVHVIFAKSYLDAVVRLTDVGVELDKECTQSVEVKVTTEDGCECNIYMLRDIPADSYFRTVNYMSYKVGKTVLLKERDSYDRSVKKYCCIHAEDICRSRLLKPTQWVITDFTY